MMMDMGKHAACGRAEMLMARKGVENVLQPESTV